MAAAAAAPIQNVDPAAACGGTVRGGGTHTDTPRRGGGVPGPQLSPLELPVVGIGVGW